MIRIAGLQKSLVAQDEFVLLQHQGTMRCVLRGHVLMSELLFRGLPGGSYVFKDEENINSGQFVLLRSGHGVNGWRQTRDGSKVFHAYACSDMPLWTSDELAHLHLLHVQHSYLERAAEPVYVGAV